MLRSHVKLVAGRSGGVRQQNLSNLEGPRVHLRLLEAHRRAVRASGRPRRQISRIRAVAAKG